MKAKAAGKKQGALTTTVVINLDAGTADRFVFDGFHKKIGWNRQETREA